MPNVSKSALVPYVDREMFTLVDHVELYPEFLPWCRSTQVHSREPEGVSASIEIAKAGVNETFTTRNTLVAHERIELELLDGPFSHLNGLWTFASLGDKGSRVQFDVDYEFSNVIIQILLAPSFESIVNSIVDAFVVRAGQVYGAR